MANAFSKEEIVFFEQVLAGFDPNNITARQVDKFMPPSTTFERSALKVWRPTPYITLGTDGLVLDAAAFADRTQLSVPSELNANDSAPSDIKNIPFKMNAVELNDELQRNRIADAAVQQLSAAVDREVATKVATYGSLFIKDAAALGTYAQFSNAELAMTVRDVPINDPRTLIMNPADYNRTAADLAQRDAPPNGVSLTAYERSRIPPIGTFDTFKANFMPTLAASAATGYLVNGVDQDWDPQATDASGNNVDNRYQTLAIDTGLTAVALGDAFTIDGVNSVSLINKNDTGTLQTFRVVGGAGGPGTAPGTGAQTITITPAIVVATGDGGAQANQDYANCSAIPADGAALTFLNTSTEPSNVFFHNRAVEIVHGSLSSVDLDGAGVATMREATDSGIEILFAKGSDVRTLATEYRLVAWFRGNVLIPEMCGNITGTSA